MDSSLSKGKKVHVFFLCALAAVFALQIWKSFQGMGPQDEHCYIALGWRIVKGDALIYDEWHVTQLISLFIAPLIQLFTALTGGMKGIVHFFRIAYVFFNALCGTALYLRFRAHGIAAALAALVYLLFTPFNIMTLSYNTMSIGFLLLSLCLLDPVKGWKNALSGVLFACAVLNTPYLILLYLIVSIAGFMKKIPGFGKRWLFFTCGAAGVAAAVMIFIFSRESLSELLSGLPHLIDKGHTDSALLLLLKGAGKLFQAYGIFLILFLLEAVYAWFGKKDPNPFNDQFEGLCLLLNLFAAVWILLIRPYLPKIGGHALVLFPFAWSGLIFLILHRKEAGMETEKFFFFASVFHALMIAVSSNVGPRSFCSMLITACCMTVLFLDAYIPKRVWSRGMVIGFSLLLLFARITGLYDSEGKLDTTIEEGPLAGLVDTKENRDKYAMLLADVNEINGMPEKGIVFVTYNAWEYLASDKSAAASSAYINPGFREEWEENQREYRVLHEEKFPAYVYLDLISPPYEMNGSEPFFSELEEIKSMKAGKLYLKK